MLSGDIFSLRLATMTAHRSTTRSTWVPTLDRNSGGSIESSIGFVKWILVMHDMLQEHGWKAIG
jgi:hypothetical protein